MTTWLRRHVAIWLDQPTGSFTSMRSDLLATSTPADRHTRTIQQNKEKKKALPNRGAISAKHRLCPHTRQYTAQGRNMMCFQDTDAAYFPRDHSKSWCRQEMYCFWRISRDLSNPPHPVWKCVCLLQTYASLILSWLVPRHITTSHDDGIL